MSVRLKADLVLENIGELATPAASGKPARRGDAKRLLVSRNVCVAAGKGKILYLGKPEGMDDVVKLTDSTVVMDLEGRLVTPGFVDCHTHPLYYGDRADEFAMRAAGADYEEIAAAGGGILNSVARTRKASREQLEETLRKHLLTMLRYGTTTVEVKSGYGLDLETESRCLDVVTNFAENWPQTIRRTFLGAHEIPEEFRGRSDDFIEFLISEVLPEIKKRNLADFVDIFCEKGVFDPDQAARYLSKAAEMGFGVRIHADEFHDTGGAAVAVEVNAMSADHLLSISDENVSRIAASDTVATLLPGTALFLGKDFPDGRKLLDAGAAVAIATDLNPGSCYCESMPFMVNLAVCACGFTVEEALTAATLNSAAALGLEHRKGSLARGMDADMIIWDLNDYRGIAYHMAIPDIAHLIVSGEVFTEPEGNR